MMSSLNPDTESGCSPEVLIVAAEASSCLYAQRLLELWREENPGVQGFGVGNQAMQDLGFETLGRAEEMAVVGVVEIISHWKAIRSVYDQILERVKKRPPKVALLLDYPEFNLRLARELKALGIPVVYYVAPQVWAWRRSRVNTIRERCDQVLVVFPFEEEFFKSHQVSCEFVGHPLLDELQDRHLDPDRIALDRLRCGIENQDFVLGLMPGSRKHELKRHLPVQLEVARELYKRIPHLRLLVMTAPSLEKDEIRAQMESFRLPYILQKDDPMEMIRLSDCVLAASGTATLQVGLLEKPMVIMYKMNALTALLARLLVRGVKHFGLVNLVAQREIVPEKMQGEANAKTLSELVLRYHEDPQYRAEVIQSLQQLKNQLGQQGATRRVSDCLQRYLQ